MILFAGFRVSEIGAGRTWWQRVFGREPDLVPHEREVAWQVAEAGWIYVVEDPGSAGGGLATLVVEDLDAEVAQLRERGVEPELVNEGKVRKAIVRDPDGNELALGQPPA